MSDNMRLEALRLAQTEATYNGAPVNAETIVARAEAFLDFLAPERKPRMAIGTSEDASGRVSFVSSEVLEAVAAGLPVTLAGRQYVPASWRLGRASEADGEAILKQDGTGVAIEFIPKDARWVLCHRDVLTDLARRSKR